MVDLPEFGKRVRVWPRPGLNVQASQTAILDGGTFLRKDGKEVEWSEFWHRRLLHGEIFLHDPRTAAEIAQAPKAASAQEAEKPKIAEASSTPGQE